VVSAKESGISDESTAIALHEKTLRFYRKRQHVTLALLLFVVVAGLPMITVPKLRQRLISRIFTLKAAAFGNLNPAVAQIGANVEPLPPEFQKPAVPILPIPNPVPSDKKYAISQDKRVPLKITPRMTRIEVAPPPSDQGEASEEASAGASENSTEAEPRYQQGKAEQVAYDLLLKTNAAVAGIVQGSNESLRYKSWDAADRGNETYWVRLKLLSKDNSEADYIWQVKPGENLVIPLNYNARTIP